MDDTIPVESLRYDIEQFVQERNWEDFHNPKDLAIAISIEAAELSELFLWKTAEESESWLSDPVSRRRLEEELADVFIFCLSLANRTGIDVSTAVRQKLALNRAKYPADLVQGKSDKYTDHTKPSEDNG